MKPKDCPLQGVFLTMEEAEDSGKTITFIPSADGLVYERRVTEAGEFVTPASEVKLLDKIIPGFVPALPRIPYTLFSQALDLFRYMMKARADGTPLEALIHIYWDKEDEKFILHVPASLWVMRLSFLMRGGAAGQRPIYPLCGSPFAQ